MVTFFCLDICPYNNSKYFIVYFFTWLIFSHSLKSFTRLQVKKSSLLFFTWLISSHSLKFFTRSARKKVSLSQPPVTTPPPPHHCRNNHHSRSPGFRHFLLHFSSFSLVHQICKIGS
ncbi:hypothetical protein HanPI659440_Chr04g0157461 [Helianthus annuus]|nr:hypothetical protein HanPI659440_Chr04g0157461 [Helianthus annuus]